MTPSVRIAATLLALAASAPAAAECRRPASPTEAALCRDPALRQADAEMNRRYAAVRASQAPAGRATLLAEQRGWLQRRDAGCRGDLACLRRAYAERNAQLSARYGPAPAAAAAGGLVNGRWRASGIGDPARGGTVDARTVTSYLADADLPPIGPAIRASGGKLCYGSDSCETIRWRSEAIGSVDGGVQTARMLGLAPSTNVITGTSGSPRSSFLLIRRPGNALAAVFTLCNADHSACRDAYQIWTPVIGTP